MKLGITDSGMIDLVTGSGGLAAETTLETAVIISLFTDRRAAADDVLPDASLQQGVLPDNRRGWCGDALREVEGDLYGSRLWLLSRAKQTEETRLRAIFYCREALAWMIEDGHVLVIDITAEWYGNDGRLNALIALTLPDGSVFKQSITLFDGGTYDV